MSLWGLLDKNHTYKSRRNKTRPRRAAASSCKSLRISRHFLKAAASLAVREEDDLQA